MSEMIEINAETLPMVWADGSDVTRSQIIKLLENKAVMYGRLGNDEVADIIGWLATLVKVLKVDEIKKLSEPCGCWSCEVYDDLKCNGCLEAGMDCQNCEDCNGAGEVGTQNPVQCFLCKGKGIRNDF